MTYIEYLNRFREHCKIHCVPAAARLLYYELLSLFNETGWPESVQIDNHRIMSMINTRAEKTAMSARADLVSAGFIHYEKGRKNAPGIYTLLDEYGSVCGSESAEKAEVNGDTIDSKKSVEAVGKMASIPEQTGSENWNESEENLEPAGSESGRESVVRTAANQEHIGRENDRHNKTKTKTKTTPQKEKPPTGVKRKTPPIPTQEETGFSAVLQSAFEEWLAYKHERKQEYKPRGLAALQNKIREAASAYGDKAAANCILDCIASNYQGLFFDRIKGEMKGMGEDDYWKL